MATFSINFYLIHETLLKVTCSNVWWRSLAKTVDSLKIVLGSTEPSKALYWVSGQLWQFYTLGNSAMQV